MKPVERNSPNNGDCLTWDDGKPLTTSEGKAWWAGWEEGNADGIADMEDVMRDEIDRLKKEVEWHEEENNRLRAMLHDVNGALWCWSPTSDFGVKFRDELMDKINSVLGEGKE